MLKSVFVEVLNASGDRITTLPTRELAVSRIARDGKTKHVGAKGKLRFNEGIVCCNDGMCWA